MPLCGRPLVAYALDTFRRAPGVGEIILAVRPQEAEAARRLVAGGPDHVTEKVVLGGAHRAGSVWAALQEASPDTDLVIIHDAARPLVSPALIERCAQAAARTGAALAALPAGDTVKRADDHLVAATLDRGLIWLAQTPQAFRYRLILDAYRRALDEGFHPTDDSAVVERLGRRVELVEGERENIKVTYPGDLTAAEAYLRARQATPAARCGIGYDVHRLVEGRPLVLGGVEFPGPVGLAGHSDADVLSHAIGDALLGAAGLGDLGRHFPDTDPRYAGVSSLELLRHIRALLAGRGLEVLHVDAVVVAEEPRIAPEAGRLCAALSNALGCPAERVSVKGTTTEGLGWAGRREGIGAYAVCLLGPAITCT